MKVTETGFQSASASGRAAIAAMGAAIAVKAVQLAAYMDSISQQDRIAAGFPVSGHDLQSTASFISKSTTIFLIVFIGALILLELWLKKAYRNLTVFRVEGLQSGFSRSRFSIRRLRQLWLASDPGTQDREAWKSRSVSPLIYLLVVAFVASAIMSVLAALQVLSITNDFRSQLARSAPARTDVMSFAAQLSFWSKFVIGAGVVLIISLIIGIWMVETINRRQAVKYSTMIATGFFEVPENQGPPTVIAQNPQAVMRPGFLMIVLGVVASLFGALISIVAGVEFGNPEISFSSNLTTLMVAGLLPLFGGILICRMGFNRIRTS